LKEDDHACYARCPASECLQVLSQADVRLAGLSPADIIGLPEGLHMIPSFVRPKVDQDACGDHAILYFMRCRAKTVGRDASAALLSKRWEAVGTLNADAAGISAMCATLTCLRRDRHAHYACRSNRSLRLLWQLRLLLRLLLGL
jgi:hypothetical protein